MARTYNQDCILAHALDLLGERWTLLIVRDLFLGPQRFGDLQAGLPGIGANLLSKRLKELEEAGLVEQAGGRYRLTQTGEELRPPIRALVKWAMMYFFERPESGPARDSIYTDNLQPDSVAFAIEIFGAHCPDRNNNYVAHLLIDDYPYTVYNMSGEMTVRRGGDSPAVATIISDVATMMQSFRMELSLEEAKVRMKMSGDERAIAHLLHCIVHLDSHPEWNEREKELAGAF